MKSTGSWDIPSVSWLLVVSLLFLAGIEPSPDWQSIVVVWIALTVSGKQREVVDLGFGKIDPDDKHNFCTFDQAAYSVLQDLPTESTCTLKIYLVANEKSGTEEQFLGEGQFPLPVDDKSGKFKKPTQIAWSLRSILKTFKVEITHRSHPFTEKSSIRGRITIQKYQ